MPPPVTRVNIVSPAGRTVKSVAATEYGPYKVDGWTIQQPAQEAGARFVAGQRSQFKGVRKQVEAGLGGILSGLSLVLIKLQPPRFLPSSCTPCRAPRRTRP